MKKIILASASPRRHELLDMLTIKHKVVPCFEEEKKITDLNHKFKKWSFKSKNKLIKEKVVEVAIQKALCVAKNLSSEEKKHIIVISADTLVVIKGEVIGKPNTREEAIRMLEKLTGNTHQVLTGLCIYDLDTERKITTVEKTNVRMVPCTKERIIMYIDNENVMDKAGAYAIQGIGAALIDKIEGCYYNVMGLPLSRLIKLLEKIGYQYF